MSKIEKFEDIEAWKRARELTKTIYELTDKGLLARDFGLRDQLRRSAISIMANIAEGFERGGDKEFRQFLAIAKGSVGELKAQLSKKNIAMPIEFAIPKVHQFLQQEGIRDQITIIASGGIRNAYDVAKAIALGADGVQIGTAEMVALECLRCHQCESGRGCVRGIATTDPELVDMMTVDWGTKRIANMYLAWTWQLKEILRRFGMRSIRELVGRTDTLVHLDYYNLPVDDDVRRGV